MVRCPTPRKVVYRSRAKAHHGKFRGQHAYHCRCGAWHLTSAGRERDRALRALGKAA